MIRLFAPLLASMLFTLAPALAQTPAPSPTPAPTPIPRREPYRLQFHFSPETNWMNDPNGLVFYNGTYHLFFQQNPNAMQMGAMHWGHATSTDLIHWTQKETAIAPDENGVIYSGSAVVDTNNTSGFGQPGKPALVAIFTSHNGKNDKFPESQSLAYSLDNGATWTKYANNPVLKTTNRRDFRDPKVFWHAPGKRWVMSLAVGDHIEFYTSPNLKNWTRQGEFGKGQGAHGGVWECPDLVPLVSNGKTRWVLFVSINPGGPNGGSATQYFVGDFDGRAFRSAQKDTRWVDYGPDNYAGVTWANTGNRKIFLGWMNNWEYGQQAPTKPWRGAMTLPRELSLRTIAGKECVISRPVPELDEITSTPVIQQNLTVRGTKDLSSYLKVTPGRFQLTMQVPRAADWSIVLSNKQGEKVTVGYGVAKNEYYFDRAHSGNVAFSPSFAKVARAPRVALGQLQQVTLLVDVASVELFADGGSTCLTGTFFPSQTLTRVSLNAPNGLTIRELTTCGIRSIWDTPKK